MLSLLRGHITSQPRVKRTRGTDTLTLSHTHTPHPHISYTRTLIFFFIHFFPHTPSHPHPSHPHPSHPHLSPLSPLFREWCEIIRHVRTLPEQKVKSLLVQEVDPAKAIMTIDLELIDSVTATDQEKK